MACCNTRTKLLGFLATNSIASAQSVQRCSRAPPGGRVTETYRVTTKQGTECVYTHSYRLRSALGHGSEINIFYFALFQRSETILKSDLSHTPFSRSQLFSPITRSLTYGERNSGEPGQSIASLQPATCAITILFGLLTLSKGEKMEIRKWKT